MALALENISVSNPHRLTDRLISGVFPPLLSHAQAGSSHKPRITSTTNDIISAADGSAFYDFIKEPFRPVPTFPGLITQDYSVSSGNTITLVNKTDTVRETNRERERERERERVRESGGVEC